MASSKPTISIKSSKKGALRAKAGVKAGQKIPVAKLKSLAKNGTPATKKQATFALNARGWAKGHK